MINANLSLSLLRLYSAPLELHRETFVSTRQEAYEKHSMNHYDKFHSFFPTSHTNNEKLSVIFSLLVDNS